VVEAVRNLQADEVAYFGEAPLRIDILRQVDGVDGAALVRNAVAATWDDLEVRVISFDDFVANKRAAGRTQDLADLERLLAIRRGPPR
jgi:hypothetical protein